MRVFVQFFCVISAKLKVLRRIKQMNVYQKVYIHINYDSIALNWLLFVTKSSNWGIKINKTKNKKQRQHLNIVIKFLYILNFEVSQRLGLWFYLANSLILFVGLDMNNLKMLRVCFYLKFTMNNQQNTARLMCEIVHILICSLPSCIRLQNRIPGK